MSAYHVPADGPTMPRSETIHGALAGRAMLRWHRDIAPIRAEMAVTIAGSLACAKRLAVRRPTWADITGDYEIAVEDRDVVAGIIDRAYTALYDAIDALTAARDAVDEAHRLIGGIPTEWTRIDTLRWQEEPTLYGCRVDDVDRIEHERDTGPWGPQTTTQETQP